MLLRWTWNAVVVSALFVLIGCSDSKTDPDKPKVCEFGKSGDPEVCDGKDNDCDEDIDEFADVLCGVDCTATPKLNCSADEYPPFGEDWPAPDSDNSSGGVILDKDGNITLGQAQQTFLHVWIANTVEGTVSKLDAETGKELGRYPSVIQNGIETGVGEMDHDGQPHDEACGQTPYRNTGTGVTPGNCPSRTAVDQAGNAYVANRAFSGQGTVTKYGDYGTEEQKLSHCDDRNNDGVIQTSTDLNGDGTIDKNSAEWVGAADECILWTRNVGTEHGVPRALAVGLNRDGAPGWVWVGLNGGDHGTQGTPQVVALDPETGLPATRDNNAISFNTSPFKPYGAVTGRDGRVWFTQHADSTKPVGYVSADASAFTVVNTPTPDGGAPYGISADRDGNIYIGSFSGGVVAYRYNPGTGQFTSVVSDDFGKGRGVAVDQEHLWVAISHENGSGAPALQSVAQYRLSDLNLVKHHDAIKCDKPIGMGVSANGNIWAVCYGPNNENGFAAFYDGANWATREVGLNPYTYSDFTGFNLNFIAEDGTYSFIAQGCTGGERTSWDGMVINEGSIPAETSVSVRIRAAASVDALKDVEYSEPVVVPQIGQVIPFDPKPQGAVLQIQLLLSTDNPDVAPKIKDIQLVKTCFVDVP